MRAIVLLVSAWAAAVVPTCGPANAQLTSGDLKAVEASPVSGVRVPGAIPLIGETGERTSTSEILSGRASVLVFADYTCSSLCGPAVSVTADALRNTGLIPGRDYSLIVIGLDPNDDVGSGARMKDERVGDDPALRAASLFLTGDAGAVEALARALGYAFSYDPGRDQFAHPAASFVLTADGRVVRVLSALDASPADLRLALVEAGEGRVGTALDRITALCYGFDPAHGVYNLAISRFLIIGALSSAMALALGIGLMLRAEARNARSH